MLLKGIKYQVWEALCSDCISIYYSKGAMLLLEYCSMRTGSTANLPKLDHEAASSETMVITNR